MKDDMNIYMNDDVKNDMKDDIRRCESDRKWTWQEVVNLGGTPRGVAKLSRSQNQYEQVNTKRTVLLRLVSGNVKKNKSVSRGALGNSHEFTLGLLSNTSILLLFRVACVS